MLLAIPPHLRTFSDQSNQFAPDTSSPLHACFLKQHFYLYYPLDSQFGILIMKLARPVVFVVGVFCLAAVTQLSADPLSVEAFASLPSVQSVRISPDGKRLAALVNSNGISLVTTLRIGSKERMKPVISTDNKKFSISWYNWANNEKLLISMRYPHRIMRTGTVETDLYSVKHDGSELQNMLDTRRANWVPQFRDRIIDFLEEEPDHVLMALDMDQPGVRDLYKVNVNTGKRTRVQRGRKNVISWMTDRQHRIRGLLTLIHKKYSVQVREVDGTKWRTLWEYQAFSDSVVSLMGFDWDPNILYVRAYHDGRYAVFKVDLRDENLTKKLMHSHPKYDVEGGLIYSSRQKKVLGIRDSRQSNGYVIWDVEMKRIFENLSESLPDTDNFLVDTSLDESRYIILATNDTHPGTFYFGDRNTGELSQFAKRYPLLGPDVLASKKRIQYVAADGQVIDGYLTLPRNFQPGTKLPAIVHPHGGPASRTRPGFDYWSSFFADRGYAVLQMDFRGSSGSGYEFMASAYKNWDTVTQGDIADGTRYLINQGIADPDRICIVGSSFGGYAALMGVASAGDLYQCAISFAGVSDLLALRNLARRFMNSELLEGQIGSRSRDLRAASPISLVENIDDPVLLIHGANDRVVDVDQSRDMYEAMKSADKAVEYVELPHGNHNLSNHFDRIQTFKLMEAFLAKHINR